MAQKKILGLNTSFDPLEYDGFHESRFCSTISLLDYDAVVIDIGFLIDSNYATGAGSFENKMRLSEFASSQIVDDFNTIKEQLVELLKQGRNLFVLMGRNENCYIYTGEKQFSGTEKMPVRLILSESLMRTRSFPLKSRQLMSMETKYPHVANPPIMIS